MAFPERRAEDRIEVSRDTLRAELSALELRIVDRVTQALSTKADQAHIDALQSRVASLEQTRASREYLVGELLTLGGKVAALERFRYSIPSLALLIAIIALADAIYRFVNG